MVFSTEISVAYAVSFIAGLLVLSASYLVLLHPLHGYPGPLLAKLTDWYSGFHAIKKDLHVTIYENHVKYGPVVRIAPNRLVFNTVTAFQKIYQNDRVVKSHTYGASVPNNVDNVFTSRDKALHRGKRQMVGAALSDRAAKSFEPTVTNQIDIYLKKLFKSSQASEPINITERVRWLALDIVGKLSFGYHLDTQTKEDNRFVSKALTFGLYRGNIWHHVFYLSKFYFDKVFDRLFFEAREKYHRLLDHMINSRIARGTDGDRDFYSFITELGADEGDIRKSELWWEANFLIIAGSDTTAAALSATFFYLSRYPTCYQNLANEIRFAFASGHDIKTGQKLSECHYLRACIDEAMRMSPPVPGTLWRKQDPEDHEPLVIDGQVVPKGTLFGVSAYALHHNEEYYPDPFVFRPERWLNRAASPEQAFSVFSAGARSCAGKPLAYMELGLVVAKTLWYFDFDRVHGGLGEVGAGQADGPPGRRRPDEYQLQDIFTSRHDGPFLKFRPRGDFWRDFDGAD
ncbi:cytochrome P450 [Nemania sp. FL0031]|nr:cytochrome P450 [Nemania sp. FL0031]